MKRFFRDIFFAVPVISAIIAFPAVLLLRSEEMNAVVFGMSPFRAALTAAALFQIGFSIFIFLNRGKHLTYLYLISGSLGILALEILLFSRFPSDDTRNLVPLLAQKAGPLFGAMIVISVCWIAGLAVTGTEPPKYTGLFLFIVGVVCYWLISSHIDRYAWQISLHGNTIMCFSLVLLSFLWFFVLRSDAGRGLKTAAGCLFLAALAFCVTRSTGMWMGRGETPPKAYWNELAEAMLQGRLYLEHPSGTHDLTLYDGKWFVPNPPLPGILLIPWVAAAGSAGAVNMTVYSAIIAGINAGLLFLLLIFAFTKPLAPFYQPLSDESSYPENSLSIAIWVTLLFVFGTDHLWLGTTGQMWFISQLLVVTFTLLALISVICQHSPILAGFFLGLGMLCRPNIFPVWLCLLGLKLEQSRPFPRLDWKKTFIWALKCGIPVVISVVLLLWYNKIRFNDWLDFGYVTINGAPWILESVQKYGMFHLHFLPVNTRVMIFELPVLDFSGERYFFQPHVAGYSIFLMTPALIYIFRAFHKKWWVLGAWASVILSVALLLLYHNTGAEQIGYRYLLDITAPLSLLVADGMRGKVGWFYRFLTVFAVVLSFIAIYWWYLGRV
ncbi:MAG: hypothetical protein IJI41_06550 [Anaerolineaceae bacterium]|nr:hypothetical protein [Anaerolineaceae bacterium]